MTALGGNSFSWIGCISSFMHLGNLQSPHMLDRTGGAGDCDLAVLCENRNSRRTKKQRRPCDRWDYCADMDLNLILNKNLDAGGQKNFQQIGGSHNVQYNADIINYHGERALDMHPLALCNTNGNGARPSKKPASTVLHCALPSRPELCRPTGARKARRKVICMEQKSCPRRHWWRRVRQNHHVLKRWKADGLQKVATRHRVLLSCPRKITRSMDILGARQQCSTVRCRHSQACMRRWNTWLERPEVRRIRACIQLAARQAER